MTSPPYFCSVSSYLTTTHHSCPTNSISFDCSVHTYILQISALSRLTVLSVYISSRFLLCLISPQVIGPVQRTQSRLTALSLDTSSIFLLCLISPQVIIPVQRIQSRLTALSIDIPSIFLLCLISPQVIIYSCPTNSVSLDCSVHRHFLRLSALSYPTTSHRSCPTNSVSLDCSVHRHLHISALSQVISPKLIIPVQRTQSRLTVLSLRISSKFLLWIVLSHHKSSVLSHHKSSVLSNELSLA